MFYTAAQSLGKGKPCHSQVVQARSDLSQLYTTWNQSDLLVIFSVKSIRYSPVAYFCISCLFGRMQRYGLTVNVS